MAGFQAGHPVYWEKRDVVCSSGFDVPASHLNSFTLFVSKSFASFFFFLVVSRFPWRSMKFAVCGTVIPHPEVSRRASSSPAATYCSLSHEGETGCVMSTSCRGLMKNSACDSVESPPAACVR